MMTIKELIENLKDPAQVIWGRGLAASVIAKARPHSAERRALRAAVNTSPSPNPPARHY